MPKREATQRELARYGKLSIGILDKDNLYLATVSVAQSGAHKGEEILKDYAYYHSMEQLLTAACKRATRAKAKSLEGYLEFYRRTKNDLKKLCEGVA